MKSFARDLEILNALMESGFNITNAALDLGCSKSAVSLRLKEMEGRFEKGFFIKGSKSGRTGSAFEGVTDPSIAEDVPIIVDTLSWFKEKCYGR